MKSPIHREMLRISLCLLLGVVTTVGVAWGLTWRDWPQHVAHFGTPPEDYIKWWQQHVPATWRSKPNNWKRLTGFGVEVQLGAENSTQELSSRGQGNLAARFLVGWPSRAMSRANLVDQTNRNPWLDSVYIDGIWIVPEVRLPIGVEYRGFLINTLFYAVIWIGLLFGVGALRRVLRRKRGCCVKCGYDLRGTPGKVCSECGSNRD